MTYAQIAVILGLSTERVRQIEKRAIAKLTHPKNKKLWGNIKDSLIELEKERAKRDNESEITR
ncbi:RNA polymerase subunit sigma-70 [Campylobacter sp. faydin G-140]|uniref:sigma factor-like helix-turn-helix DNA-binding protein n=1 Tax=Campylobacter anatolicus TaxID=2829105 RepID=UPI001B9FB97E|nr:sigma factor-like helix-turn-helix DNA-binding protein [Campylobacter anatolicus]MBR8466357.1 RNA polymerase subunit sigma-70 [Campylobacter anatolicus]